MNGASKPIVCVIDDDVSVRDSLVALVDCCGYSGVSYGSAEQFLQAGAVPQAKFLIVDVRLPGMSGIELLQKLAAAGLGRPAVVVTGHADSEDFGRTDVHFLPKPCPPDRLLEIIAMTLTAGDS